MSEEKATTEQEDRDAQSENGHTTPNDPPEPAQDPLERLRQEAEEKDNKYKYLYADFENFKKRTVKERSDYMKFGWEPLALQLLEVLDNMERAFSFVDDKQDQNLRQGLNMVTEQFKQTLEKFGVQPIKTIGKPFNPEQHEALEMVESQEEEGIIVGQQVGGYLLHGRLLRPARVMVSKGLAEKKQEK